MAGQITGDDPDWWRGAVIYQVYPRSFGDTDGDGIGDLPGITAHLPHIAALGADAVWISPFFTSPMKDFGYDVSDYRDVDPIFGTLADFDALVAESHRLGLKVMIDLVLSHTSDRHPWFVESRASRDNPRAEWYVWSEPKVDGTPPNNWLSIFGGPAWQWDTRRRQYYLHNFLVEQPDLNFHNEEVVAALMDVARFWLDRGVNGFRHDTLNFYFHDAALTDNPPAPQDGNDVGPSANPYNRQHHIHSKNRPEMIAFLDRLRGLLDEYGAAMVGEVGDTRRGLELMAEYTAPGLAQMCYAFDFLEGPLTRPHFERSIRRFEAVAGDGWACWAFSNHDVIRHASRWSTDGRDSARVARLAASLLLSLRGSVCIYQGEELGLPQAEVAFEDLVDPYGIAFWPEIKGRDGCRTPMPWAADAPNAGFSDAPRTWLPIPDAHRPLAVDREAARPQGTYAAYREMLAFRRGHPALVKGAIRLVEGHNGEVLAFVREHEGTRILCAFNLGPDEAILAAPEVAGVRPLDGHPHADEAWLEGGTLRLRGLTAFFGHLPTN